MARMASLVEGFVWELRYALRILIKAPVFTFTAVVTLTLGIGANSAIFSVINAVLLRSLPFKESDRLVRIYNAFRRSNIETSSWKDIAFWQQENTVFESIEAFGRDDKILSEAIEPAYISSGYASAGFFQLLGVFPVLGRTFISDDYDSNANTVVVLGEGFWKERFGADPHILERSLVIDGYETVVIGVIPDRFDTLAGHTQVWLPFNARKSRDARFLRPIARLKSGITLGQAGSDMEAIALRLQELYPHYNRELSATVVPLESSIVGSVRLPLMVLFGAVGLVLLMACAGVANLLLARGTARWHELALRFALGASRKRLLRQLLSESLLLSVLSGIPALVLANIATTFLATLIRGDLPRLEEVRLDGRVVVFTILLSLGSTLIFGLAPALQAVETNFNEALKEGFNNTAGGQRQARVRSVLVISELAISVVLLIACGLFFRSFYQLRNENLGFTIDNITTTQLLFPSAKYRTEQASNFFYNHLVGQLGSMRGVQSAALCDTLPLNGSGSGFWADASSVGSLNRVPAQRRRVSPAYFRTMQIPLLEGRDFNEFDGFHGNESWVALISQSLARRLWPSESSVGKSIVYNDEIVPVAGVVGDVKRAAPDTPDDLAIYFPITTARIVARSSANEANVAAEIGELIRSIDKDVLVTNPWTMNKVLDSTLLRRRFVLLLLTIFAGLALLLSSVGTYGVVSYTVGRRTPEIGIRIALGASRWNVTSLVVGQAAKLALIGATAGFVAALALMPLVEALLFKVSPTDPAVFALASVLPVFISLFASYIPARKATKIDACLALSQR